VQPEQTQRNLASLHGDQLGDLDRQQPVFRFRLQLRLRDVLRAARRHHHLHQEEIYRSRWKPRNETVGDVERGGSRFVVEEPEFGCLRGKLQRKRDSRVALATVGQGRVGSVGREAHRSPADY